MESTYQAGNTVRLTCAFKDYTSGTAKDPELIKVIIYDYRYNKIGEFTMTGTNKTGVGEYFYDYEIPFATKPTKFYYEWYGEISGSPSLKRGSFKVTFI